MKLRKLAVLSLTVAVALVFSGCTKEQTAEEKGTAASEKSSVSPETVSKSDKSGVTLSFMASQDWIQDAEIDLSKKFTEETGIKVDYQIIPSDQYVNLLMTKLNTGECTDIFGAQSGKFDIKDQINVEKNAVDLSGTKWSSQVEPLVADELSVDGTLYGQPIQDVSSVWAIGYNKQIFKKLNLEIPTDYQSFTQVCDAMAAQGIIPIYECVSDGWHHTLWLPETGVQAETVEPGIVERWNNNEVPFAGNTTLETILNQINDMISKGYWGEDYMSNTYADSAKNIASGKYAMTIANQGFGVEVNKVNPEIAVDDIGYFVIPLADNQTLNVNPAGPARFVFSGSKHAAEAQQYLEFLAREENLTYLTENVGKFNKLPFENAPSMYTETIQDFYNRYDKKGTVLQTAVKYVNPQWSEIGANLSAMIVGEMAPEEVLTSIDEVRAQQAKAASDPAWK
ncbi:ABC transporter substrate-binding protein [Lacrimispora sphenoides]|uniref:Raffinose/stachyose/melibiose transport system substrate-binding protein n=1 Tax=Lacrimispora sphenoides JCM 1415 TaxID=1297793 RepID=A0ABY1C3V3_9FIRM|nr:ABC transporter substrate-binding protein [Lacrimispora sphenoides]SET62220.1 raffinose/stachyose/melibiose transport system substrate-binding protein [[Clostridium] sphenoides JCM 1415]SUY50113.1 extracellular solute-binding protein [Lacrimispora sphenoides]